MSITTTNIRVPIISKFNYKDNLFEHGIMITDNKYNAKKHFVIPCPTTIVTDENNNEFFPFVKVYKYKHFDSLYPLPKSIVESFEYILKYPLKFERGYRNNNGEKYYCLLGTQYTNYTNNTVFSNDLNSIIIIALLSNIHKIFTTKEDDKLKINKKLLPLMYTYDIEIIYDDIQDSDNNILLFSAEKNIDYDLLNKSGSYNKNLEFIKNYHVDDSLSNNNFMYKYTKPDEYFKGSLYRFKEMTRYLNKKIQLIYSERIDKQTVYFRGIDILNLEYPDTYSVTDNILRPLIFGEKVLIIVEDPGHHCFDIDFTDIIDIDYDKKAKENNLLIHDSEYELLMPPTIYHEIETVNKNILIVSSNKDINITKENKNIINKAIETYNRLLNITDNNVNENTKYRLLPSIFYMNLIKSFLNKSIKLNTKYKLNKDESIDFCISDHYDYVAITGYYDNFKYCLSNDECIDTHDFKVFIDTTKIWNTGVIFLNSGYKDNGYTTIPLFYIKYNIYDKSVNFKCYYEITKATENELYITVECEF